MKESARTTTLGYALVAIVEHIEANLGEVRLVAIRLPTDVTIALPLESKI
jgi:purine nucleosidase